MKRAVVTGATGVIGSALVDCLVQAGVEVYVMLRPTSKRWDHIPKHRSIHVIPCELHEIETLPQRIGVSCEAFFHLAWQGTADPANRFDMYMQNDNVRCALDAVETARGLGCKVFVGSGSQAEYGEVGGIMHPDTVPRPISGYGMAKLCAGQMTRQVCHEYGIRHIWPRILSVYGIHDGEQTLISSAINRMLAGEKISMTAGTQLWDYLYAADAADALYRMALNGRDGAVYVLGSGQARPLREYVEIIRDVINPACTIGFGEVPYRKDQVMHLEADITELTKDTGWVPSTKFDDGIRMILSNKS